MMLNLVNGESISWKIILSPELGSVFVHAGKHREGPSVQENVDSRIRHQE